jgi:hypothetical protein
MDLNCQPAFSPTNVPPQMPDEKTHYTVYTEKVVNYKPLQSTHTYA